MQRVKLVFATIAAIMVLLILFRAPLSYALRGVGAYATGSIGAGLWRAGVSARDAFTTDNGSLRKRVADLEAERDRLIVDNAKLKGADIENRRLSELLQFAERSEAPIKAASVVGGSTDPDLHYVSIDVGAEDGVVADDAVIAGDGIVVGKIESASARSATVELLTDSRSRFAAVVLSADGQATGGVTEGGHGTGMVMRLIPQNAPVKAGDTVVTSGLESGVPRGLTIGRVESVHEEPNEPFQTAAVSPIVDLDSLTSIGVILAPR